MLTPIKDGREETDPEKRYNGALKKVRIGVEHAFGMLKKRFPCLLYMLRCDKMENIQSIIGIEFQFLKSLTFLKFSVSQVYNFFS